MAAAGYSADRLIPLGRAKRRRLSVLSLDVDGWRLGASVYGLHYAVSVLTFGASAQLSRHSAF